MLNVQIDMYEIVMLTKMVEADLLTVQMRLISNVSHLLPPLLYLYNSHNAYIQVKDDWYVSYL